MSIVFAQSTFPHPMRRPSVLLRRSCVLLLLAAGAVSAASPVSGQEVSQEAPPSADVAAPYREAALARWNDDIRALEQLDAEETDPADAVLLLGSSSIRLWDDAARGLAPYRVIRRGYGGARFTDLVVFAERLIQPHSFRAAVIFVANDIAGSDQDRTPAEVEPLVRHIIAVAREHQPEASVLLVEVTPTPRRLAVWPRIREFNAMLREVALTEPHVAFVATAEHYLDSHDRPRAEFFRDDRLHQNEAGYELWASLIRDRLDEVLRAKANEDAQPRPLD